MSNEVKPKSGLHQRVADTLNRLRAGAVRPAQKAALPAPPKAMASDRPQPTPIQAQPVVAAAASRVIIHRARMQPTADNPCVRRLQGLENHPTSRAETIARMIAQNNSPSAESVATLEQRFRAETNPGKRGELAATIRAKLGAGA
jgi:hypothetical protein